MVKLLKLLIGKKRGYSTQKLGLRHQRPSSESSKTRGWGGQLEVYESLGKTVEQDGEEDHW
jgi:hypothetical protein